MKKLGSISRRELFESVERAALLPLPTEPFVVSEWKRATVNVDYHVQLAEHFYSVPYTLVREEVEARLTATTVEIFYRVRRVPLCASGRCAGSVVKRTRTRLRQCERLCFEHDVRATTRKLDVHYLELA